MKIVVGITGASGIVYGIKLIEELSKNNEVFVVVTENAKKVIRYEFPDAMEKIPKNAKILAEDQIDASISSSSFDVNGMVVCPCSMKTVSAISVGFADNLVQRCADVMIKEQKKLILVIREMPFSAIHLENMLKLSRIGVTIMSACPGFYHKPRNLDELINFVVGKILDNLGIENKLYKRWNNS